MMKIIAKLKTVFLGKTIDSKEGSWENWQDKWDDERVDNIWGQKLRDEDWRRDPAYQVISERFKAFGTSVVDLGSGGGVLYRALKEYCDHVDYVGGTGNRFRVYVEKSCGNISELLAGALSKSS